MPTFSDLVDQLVVETARPDRRSVIASSLNATIRELHFRNISGGGAPIQFFENLIEEEFVPGPILPTVWPITRPAVFMGVEAIKCETRNIFFVARTPRTARDLERDSSAIATYYRTGNQIALAGALPSSKILLAYYEYLPSLGYILPLDRKVTLDANGNYVRKGGGAVLTLAELAKETNWMLNRHEAALRNGTMAKFYTSINDIERSRMVYSTYETLRSGIQSQETLV